MPPAFKLSQDQTLHFSIVASPTDIGGCFERRSIRLNPPFGGPVTAHPVAGKGRPADRLVSASKTQTSIAGNLLKRNLQASQGCLSHPASCVMAGRDLCEWLRLVKTSAKRSHPRGVSTVHLSRIMPRWARRLVAVGRKRENSSDLLEKVKYHRLFCGKLFGRSRSQPRPTDWHVPQSSHATKAKLYGKESSLSNRGSEFLQPFLFSRSLYDTRPDASGSARIADLSRK